MNNEFKKIDQGDVTRYVLESASGGGTSAGNVASVSKSLGGVQRRSNLLVQDVGPKLTPRSPVAHAAQKVAKGSGRHTDRKQQSKQVRGEKHKTKDFAENQDHEISMAGSELHSIFQNAKQLHSMIKTKSEEEGLDAWQQSKITKAADYLNSVLQSLQHEMMGEGDRTMSRAAKGMMKYGKDGMKALAKAGREGASEKQLDTICDKHDHYNEGWSQKYKNSINCSHPKGFSQRAHCAGKRKHNESIEMEMTCPDCGMCKTHGNNMMEVKQRLDAKCWKGKHKEGTKIKGGIRVNNCVPNEGVTEDTTPTTGLQSDGKYYNKAGRLVGKWNGRTLILDPEFEQYHRDEGGFGDEEIEQMRGTFQHRIQKLTAPSEDRIKYVANELEKSDIQAGRPRQSRHEYYELAVQMLSDQQGVAEDIRTKAHFRQETNDALADFLARGGKTQEVPPNHVRVKPGQGLASKHIGSRIEAGRAVGKDRRVQSKHPVVSTEHMGETHLDELDRPSGKLFIIVKADNAGATHVFGDFGSFPRDVVSKISKRGTRDKSGAKTKLKIDFLFDDFRSTIQQLRTIFRDVDFVGAEAAEFIIHSSALRSDQGEDVKHLRDYIEAGDDRRMKMYQKPEDDEEDDGETTGGNMLRIDPETGAARKVVGVKPQTQMGGKSVEQPGMTTYRFKNPVFAQKLRGMNSRFNIKGDTITVDQRQKDDLISMLGDRFSDVFTNKELFREGGNYNPANDAAAQQLSQGTAPLPNKGSAASQDALKAAMAQANQPKGADRDLGNGFTLTTTDYEGKNVPAILDTQDKSYWIDPLQKFPNRMQYGFGTHQKIQNGKMLNAIPGDQTAAAMKAAGWAIPERAPARPSSKPANQMSDEELEAELARRKTTTNTRPTAPAPTNEDAYMESLSAALEQKLSVNDTPEVWRDDFEHADPVKYPQFRNKTVEKKHRMADVARYRQIQKK